MRETVQAVANAAISEGMSVVKLAEILQIDKGAASRRWAAARARGYVKNLEDKRGKPARIVVADPLPTDVQVLPTTVALLTELKRGSQPPGDEGFDEFLLRAVQAEQITQSEAFEQYELHKLIKAKA